MSTRAPDCEYRFLPRAGGFPRALLTGCALLAGCQAPPAAAPTGPLDAVEQHSLLYGQFKLPVRVGVVENRGPQLPVVSPDGSRMLYLKVDADTISHMTLFGSSDPADTPPEGTLSIWICPIEGTPAGRQLSRHRWAHSPAWSPSGQAVVYVSNEPDGSRIVHHDVVSGTETLLGRSGAVNCLPRFDGDDRTLLFCSAASSGEAFRILRQQVGDAQPAALTPEGQDCVLPVRTDDAGRVICASAGSGQLRWVTATPEGTTDLTGPAGDADRPALLTTWAGISEAGSPERSAFLYYDSYENRITVCDPAHRRLARHRSGSIAACWLDGERFALATADQLFTVHAFTGVSVPLMSGAWIPVRYVPAERRLIVFGQGPGTSRLNVYSIVFETVTPEQPPGKEKP